MILTERFTVANMFSGDNKVVVGGSRFDVPEAGDLVILHCKTNIQTNKQAGRLLSLVVLKLSGRITDV